MRVTGIACVVLAAGTLAACSGGDGPDKTVDAFLTGWQSGQLSKVGFVDPTGQKVPATTVAEQIKSLSGELGETPPALKREGDPKVTEDIATSTVTVDWTLPGGTHWTYPTTLRLRQGKDDAWQVIWEPKIVQEKLSAGDALATRRLAADRGEIVDAGGQPIVQKKPVVVVGVEPQRVTQIDALVKDMDRLFKSVKTEVDLADLPGIVAKAQPNAFVDVVSLRQEVFAQIEQSLRDLPGTVFREEQRYLAPSREFARALLGTVDPVLKEDMDKNPGKFVIGDLIGHGGLQGRYDEKLRGTTGQAVVVTRKNPQSEGPAETVAEVFRSEPKPGAPLKVTLDRKVQNAADAALKGNPRNTAIVALKISDGSILAVANGPGASGNNLAFNASVPPGSTFKMVSALGLLDAGAVSLNGTVDCPKTLNVPGRPPIKNAHDMVLGKVPFRVDFAKSCNTAFASLAPKLGDDGLGNAGRSLGLEGKWDLGIDAFTGKVSAGGSEGERAAAAFGQGTTVVSPLAMASATAAVARGQWQQPKLLLDPAPASTAPAGPQLKASSVTPLRQMMREVVTAGHGAALKDVPGGPVHGKTGTAEYDNNPAHTHAWFVGWQGDIAFAVFVENGGDSTATSVPLTEKFLRAL
ncbi:penicillin-binding transpeptidase domain-containing protein [Phytohabitans aurantiacus]|jgi:cell division protein FtsI/penicillin-binding protein 2|uniref:Cell division protein FtsI n=1 Tax=Phytohabitans aurantiacus TaxID=3016789 RepID=A0ABQ5R9K7_9ACTN|nr:penicillin-binding transpeptidase domain-containing protein [Phytohabitans aurantiacus]GLI03263.1 cell division protein FtsI [Phytohabitans aurantiacus]